MPGDNLAPAPRRNHVWHHRIHQQWAGEDLTFWRLAFFPRYDREQVVAIIHEILAKEEVQSYALYEALGLFDLFIRAWLPRKSSDQLGESLNEALKSESLQLLEPFIVTRVLRHHVWDKYDDDGGLLPEDAHEGDVTALMEALGDERIEQLNEGRLSPEEADGYRTDRVLAPLPPPDGIKFFIVITSAVFSITWGARESLKSGLLDALTDSRIREPSLYEGSGFGQYVVMGRVAPEDFFAITTLSTAINNLGIGHSVTARPYTHVGANERTLYYEDRISTKRLDGPQEIGSLLERDESQILEVKGSLRLNLARWLDGQEEKPVADNSVANEGVIRTAVGMLNADGGQIVVGAVERKARFGSYVADEHPKLKTLPRSGQYICLGINQEYGDKGWDGFRLDLQNLLATRIQPSPGGSFSVSRETVAGRDLCVIKIRPSQANWFYRVLGPKEPVKFYVRDGNRTVAYAGVSADAYKRERPRG